MNKRNKLKRKKESRESLVLVMISYYKRFGSLPSEKNFILKRKLKLKIKKKIKKAATIPDFFRVDFAAVLSIL